MSRHCRSPPVLVRPSPCTSTVAIWSAVARGVHILTGGHWGVDPIVEKRLGDYKYAHSTSSVDNMLLGSKLLWRQGLVRCPTRCDESERVGDKCTCGCPKEYWGGRNASQILHESGIARIFPLLDLAWVDAEWNDGGADDTLVSEEAKVGWVIRTARAL